VPPGFGGITTISSNTLAGVAEGPIFDPPGVTSLEVRSAGGGLLRLSNILFQAEAPQAVPEPMSLSLFGLGHAGLPLAKRRCS
jgi:hypothetical protein